MVAGIAVAMLAVLGCSVGVIAQEQQAEQTEAPTELRPFWSNEASASNLAVVQVYQAEAGTWGQAAP